MEARVTWSAVRGLQGVVGREADVLRLYHIYHMSLEIIHQPTLRSIIQTKLLSELSVIHRVTCLSQVEYVLLQGVVFGSLWCWQVFADDCLVVAFIERETDPTDTYR